MVYSLEEGAGKVWLTRFVLLMVVIFLATVYHLTEFRNFSAPEAMDSAQLARNIAEGKGFTTRFIRPASVYLMQKQAAKRGEDVQKILRKPHPDLANPPVYPLLLAAWMKVLPFQHDIQQQESGGLFERHQPDVLIGWLNLGLFGVMLLQVFFLARRLFDAGVAGLSVAIVLGMEAMWRFSYSGLSTMLLFVVFLAILRLLVAIEAGASAAVPRAGWKTVGLALVVGGLVGVGCMTRYSFGWFILPVGVYILVCSRAQRWLAAPATVAAFLVVIAPWLYRNYTVCGQPFGVATYTVVEETAQFTGTRLLRSMMPDLSKAEPADVARKLMLNSIDLLQNEVTRIGGSWVSAFFIVGLLVPYNNKALQRLRWFILGAIATAIATQALGRTWLTGASPTINSENVLVLLAPVLAIYGVSLFYLLLDRLEFPVPQFRSILVGVFAIAASLPLIFVILPPRTPPIVYPPYHPAMIQNFANFLNPTELMMTDMPWATAWYGRRDSVWTTLRVKDDKGDDFFAINDFQRPVAAVYITPISADAPLRPAFLRDPDFAWGRFYMDALLLRRMPDGFPLKHMYGGGLVEAGHFFLTDWPRWLRKEK